MTEAEIDLLDEMMPLGADQIAQIMIARYKDDALAAAKEYAQSSGHSRFAVEVAETIRALTIPTFQ